MSFPVAPAQGRSVLSDGEWHRLHPLTPLLRGGLVLVVVIGVIITNMRDRLVQLFLPSFAPDLPTDEFDYEGDPIDWVIENELILLAAAVLAGLLLIVVACFYMSWRFHTFRITHDEVEVRSGILFRTHRRAKLDRVQGVNLTRPMIARLLGAAKLEVVGAGTDGDVKLEYLSTTNAEQVRADILRLASGRQLDAQVARGAGAFAGAGVGGVDGTSAGAGVGAGAGTSVLANAANAVSEGITGIFVGADAGEVEPESVVTIPVRRLLLSHLLSPSTVVLVLAVAAVIVGGSLGSWWALFGIIPAIIAFGAYWVSAVFKGMRYSIAPTRNGVRITFGLLTTVTEIIPPGRIHAIEIRQSILWRPAGWWKIKINRMTGKSATDGAQDQFTTVLPVGTRADVERVMGLLMPGVDAETWPSVFEHGVLGPREGDPFTNTPRRARLFTLLSWKRNGFVLSEDALALRRGVVWRTLALFPFARMQSIALKQGPIDRQMRVAKAEVHTVLGPVVGHLSGIDRDAALGLFDEVSERMAQAASDDQSHRWAEGEAEDVEGAGAVPAVPVQVAPVQAARTHVEPEPEPEPADLLPADLPPVQDPIAVRPADEPPAALAPTDTPRQD